MSIKFPINPDELINAIQEDAPVVYDILREYYFQEAGEGSAPPTSEELMEQLENYSGDNFDVHYWNGRWSIMRELITQNDHDDTIGRDNTARFLNDMTSIYYGYHLIRCEVCDTVHRLSDIDNGPCHCGALLDNDHPDLFF